MLYSLNSYRYGWDNCSITKKGLVYCVADSPKPMDAGIPEDEIQSSLTHTGASAPSVDRLGRVARDMEELEWKILRKAAGAGGGSHSGGGSAP